MKTTLIKLSAFLYDFFLVLLLTSLPLWVTTTAANEIISRVSVNSKNDSGNGDSLAPAISANGRYLAFQSDANNLVDDDTNSFTDIFVYDRQTRQTQRVSVSSTGTQANFNSYFPAISGDGRYVTFQSDAYNLVTEEDTNESSDIFVHDRHLGTTTLVSVSRLGGPGDSTSSEPSISADGRYIAFHSYASDLVKQDTNRKIDVFIRDLETQETTRVSVASKGSQGNDASYGAFISANGRYVAFNSEATNLVKGDTNKATDVFVYDRDTGEMQRISIDSKGQQGDVASFNPALSADGRYVTFASRATNLVAADTNEIEDIFVHDRETGETTLVSIDPTGQPGTQDSFGPSLSADGRYVLFNSDADNLIAEDDNQSTDVFIHDRDSAQTHRLTLISEGERDTHVSFNRPVMSSDGRWVAFESMAWNLVVEDYNNSADIFLYDREYYASFEVATGKLYIPVLTVPDFGLFRASLYLVADSTPLQLTVARTSAFDIPLPGEIPSSYLLDTGHLRLPKLEVFNPPEEILQCAVEMVADEALTVFSVTAIECGSP